MKNKDIYNFSKARAEVAEINGEYLIWRNEWWEERKLEENQGDMTLVMIGGTSGIEEEDMWKEGQVSS